MQQLKSIGHLLAKNTSKIFIILVNSNTLGEITDTLVLIKENKYCDDTLLIPLKANCVNGVLNNVYKENFYVDDDVLYLLSDEIKDVLLFDVLGTKILDCKYKRNNLSLLPVGLYVLQYKENNNIKITKIIRY